MTVRTGIELNQLLACAQAGAQLHPDPLPSEEVVQMNELDARPDERELRERLGVSDDLDLVFYGGAPGLEPGDPILPRLGLPRSPLPAVTSVPLDRWVGEARSRATEWFEGGDLYLAEGLGEEIELAARGRCWRAAKVLKVLERGCVANDLPARRPEPSPFFHGGFPGLEVGDLILPPLHTESIGRRATDRVWMNAELSVAWAYAASTGGDVYEVRPQGFARFEAPDSPVVIAESALIVAVIARDVDASVPETTDPRPPELRT